MNQEKSLTAFEPLKWNNEAIYLSIKWRNYLWVKKIIMPEKNKKTGQLNVMWYPGLDPTTTKNGVLLGKLVKFK